MISWPIYLFVIIELTFVTIGDIKYKKIPNLWSILNIALAATLFILFPQTYEFSLETFQYSIVFIFVGFLLFLLKIMGGGDSKFLASFFLIVPITMQDTLFYYLLISTVFVGLITLVNNIFQKRAELIESLRNMDIQGVKSCFGTKFAYAPVILVSWLLIGLNKIDFI